MSLVRTFFDRVTGRETLLAVANARIEAEAATAIAVAQGIEDVRRAASAAIVDVAHQTGAYRWDDPYVHATAQSPKRRPKGLLNVEDMRRFAAAYDILRSCIDHLKREVRSVPGTVRGRDGKKPSDLRLRRGLEFFGPGGGLAGSNEGGPHAPRRVFESSVIEDMLVVGAMAVWLEPTRGGGIFSARAVDATTILPRQQLDGWVDPERAYEQQVMGVTVGVFPKRDLIYDGFSPRTYNPYFASPVEHLAGAVVSALKADEWNRTWLTDGNVPDQLISVPESWTPKQVKEYADYFDALLAGDSAARHKAKIVPSGTKPVWAQTRKDADFAEFERWLMQRTCSIMGVQPTSIGFAGETYKFSQESGQKQTSRFGGGEILEILKDLYDLILIRNGFDDLEWWWQTEGEEDPNARTERLVNASGGPYITANEARAEEGLAPIAGGDELRGTAAEETEKPGEKPNDDSEAGDGDDPKPSE